MRRDVYVYLDNVLANPPANVSGLEIELNFDRDRENVRGRLNVSNLDIVNENAVFVEKWIEDGKIFDGIPLRIELQRNGVAEILFDGYLDLANDTLFSRNRCGIKAVEKGGIDRLNTLVNKCTYQHLYNIGLIKDSDFEKIPYILNSVPDYTGMAISTMGIFVVLNEIQSVIERLGGLLASLAAAAVDPSVVIQLISYAVYLPVLILSLIKLVKNIISLIIQPVKYHSCMSVYSQLKKGAEYLGYTFRCEFMEAEPFNALCILPEKYYNPVNKFDKNLLGFTNPTDTKKGFFNGTFGDLINECKKMFNTKLVVKNNHIDMVIDNLSETNQSGYVIQDYYNPNYKLNTDDLKSNTVLSFKTDTAERNTYQQYQGTSLQVTVEPTGGINKLYNAITGLEEININFALAKTKTDLTNPESYVGEALKIIDNLTARITNVANKAIKLANKAINAINKVLKALRTINIKLNLNLSPIKPISIPTISSLIEDRKGMLLLETDIVTVPKIFLLKKGTTSRLNKIKENNDRFLSAKYLWDNYHYYKSFVPSGKNKNGNQYKIFDYDKIPFTYNHYKMTKNNNLITDVKNGQIIIDTLLWNPWNETAKLSVRIPYLYTSKLKETHHEPDGN